MKLKHVDGGAQHVKRLSGFRAASLGESIVALGLLIAIGGLLAALLLSAVSMPAHAVDATWLASPSSDDWNTGVNWAPTNAPMNPGDTATFGLSTNTLAELSGDVTIESMTFDPGGDAFTVGTGTNILTLLGAGIVNNSETVQTINNAAIEGSGQTILRNGATAGAGVVINNAGAKTSFFDGSNAGSATINNFLGVGGPGTIVFLDTSTAGNATVNNSDGATLFLDASSAGNATILNGSGGLGGSIEFFNAATAGNATITNMGTTSFVGFHDSATAGNSIINNIGGALARTSSVAFFDNSGAGSATINNSSRLSFLGNSSAGNARINNRANSQFIPPESRTVLFGDSASAGNATINNAGQVRFLGSATAANAMIVNESDQSFTFFGQRASGGNAALINASPTAFISIAGLDGPGTTVGSIAGGGFIFLGAKNLTVGGNQRTTVFSGQISDSGSLTKIGAGTLTLAGANTYTGGTTISGGMIRTQNASALGTGPVAFGNGAALQIENLLSVNGNWTVSPGTANVSGGTVQTFGDFNLNGGGSLIANANFSIPGRASINSGALVVNNRFAVDRGLDINGASSAVVNGVLSAQFVNANNVSSLIVETLGVVAADVNVGPSAQLLLAGRINGMVTNGGLLQGTGVIAGSLNNTGILAPGASLGRLTINGNYTQRPSGTLRIEVAGSSPGQYDVLAVNGRISLAGRLQFVSLGGFKLRVGDQIAFLIASGGVSGTFATVENEAIVTGTIVTGEVVYGPNGVVLEGTQGSFSDFVEALETDPDVTVSPNSLAVARALDSLIGDPRAAELLAFLNGLPLSELPRAFEQISPEEVTSINVVGVSTANVQGNNLAQRLGDIRAGGSGFSSTRFSINGSGPSFWEGFAGPNGPEGQKGEAAFAPFSDSRWGVFLTGVGEFTNVDSTFGAPGYDLATGGLTLGVDYRIGSNFAVGLTGGYAYTGVSLVEDGNIQVNGGKLGVYATAFSSGFYLDTAVTGGFSGYDLRRTGLDGDANGKTVGGDLNVFVAAGYDWKKGGLSIGPTASFQYTLAGFKGFTESGSLAPLAFADQDSNSLRTAFGMRTSYDWKLGPVRLIPETRGAWQHEYGETDYSIVASFANGAGDSFTVNGPPIGRDSFLFSAGLAVQWNDRITTYAYYDGEFFRANYLSNNVSAGFRITF